MRRDFIANAAHELRTPLTNLQGYLEALRDGVITADRSTYESLHEEAERLVRLSRSLDALAEGDAADEPAGPPVDRPRRGGPHRGRARPAGDRASRAAARRRRAGDPAGPREPRPARPGARQPAVERRPLHAARRHGHRPCRAAAGRPARVRHEHWRARSRRTTSLGCSSGSTASRSRATGRAAVPGSGSRSSSSSSRRAGGRVGAESRDGPDALLVQPAGLSDGSGQRDRRRAPRAIPPSPSHWTRSEPLAQQHDGDDDRHDRAERAGEPDDPGRRLLEPDREGTKPDDVEHARRRPRRARAARSAIGWSIRRPARSERLTAPRAGSETTSDHDRPSPALASRAPRAGPAASRALRIGAAARSSGSRSRRAPRSRSRRPCRRTAAAASRAPTTTRSGPRRPSRAARRGPGAGQRLAADEHREDDGQAAVRGDHRAHHRRAGRCGEP